MKELVVISGKGGTGKTSIVAAFAALAASKVLADCDVDAADLHLVLDPNIRQREVFTGGSVARIKIEECERCDICRNLCRFDAIDDNFRIDEIACEGCGVCHDACQYGAIELATKTAGEWYISETRHGMMVHAKLGIAEENSGKLVSLVRTQARKIAAENRLELVIIDGSPGIGCPVIASMTGVDLALAVTEPTLSGIHDLERVAGLAKHFGNRLAVCVNKWDINPEMTGRIENWCRREGLAVAGKIAFDPIVTRAQIAGVSVIEYSSGSAALEIKKVWRRIAREMELENIA
ncbi:MAG: 4Fe-4S binding protein [Deltaproteobacteria bacterium]|nr:4Fe-4S binding protein [Deltaproteobacteria bacterium]